MSHFGHRIEVRFRDCDPMGHMNNAVYFTFLEQTRFSHWRSL
jgi:acyl-CoA thioester hydrolase